MAVERERVQIVMLRILGILLVAVGFTMIARSAERPSIADQAQRVAVHASEASDRCERLRVEVRQHTPPRPPRPPKPPKPPTFVFVN